MRANELMLGDWVMTEAGVMRVVHIFKNHIDCDVPTGCKTWEITTIEPIPLTPEILEKNGFKARVYEELVLEADEYCFALQKGVDGINAWWWEMFSSPIIPINHVHELQHCLKLVGIEKTIDL